MTDNTCKDCIFLVELAISEQVSVISCQRPDGTGNTKGSKDVGACEQFKQK